MITSINSENAGRYKALFDDASAALKKIDDGETYDEIYDLEGYFSVLEQLSKIDIKYTILPLDEEYFKIDANTRTIEVPTSFKKNGIAVQGDEVAEILYFKIARYFDFTDLNTTDIVIQWETDTQSGISAPYARDIVSDPNYLIFGWPIDSDITAKAGTIKFSVRFLRWDKSDANEPKIIYSLSTLTASAVINPGLDFEASDLIPEDKTNFILNRIVNATPAGGSTANEPKFLLGLDTSKEIDLDPETGIYTFKVQAYSTDAGTITYSWKKGDSVLNGKVNYEETKDTVADGKKVYYSKSLTEDNVEKYIAITTLKEGDSFKEEHLDTVYEKFSYLTVNSVGSYSAIATNRVNKSTTSATSGPVIVPGPSNSEITFVLEDPIMKADDYQVILQPTVTNSSTSNLNYQWYKDGEPILNATTLSYTVHGDGITSEAQGNYSLQVTAKRNGATASTESELYWITYAAKEPDSVVLTSNYYTAGEEVAVDQIVFENNYYDNKNTYSYQWYMIKSNDEKIAIAGETDAIYKTNIMQGGVKICCGVKNNYNGTVSDETYSAAVVLSAAD